LRLIAMMFWRETEGRLVDHNPVKVI